MLLLNTLSKILKKSKTNVWFLFFFLYVKILLHMKHAYSNVQNKNLKSHRHKSIRSKVIEACEVTFCLDKQFERVLQRKATL